MTEYFIYFSGWHGHYLFCDYGGIQSYTKVYQTLTQYIWTINIAATQDKYFLQFQR